MKKNRRVRMRNDDLIFSGVVFSFLGIAWMYICISMLDVLGFKGLKVKKFRLALLLSVACLSFFALFKVNYFSTERVMSLYYFAFSVIPGVVWTPIFVMCRQAIGMPIEKPNYFQLFSTFYALAFIMLLMKRWASFNRILF